MTVTSYVVSSALTAGRLIPSTTITLFPRFSAVTYVYLRESVFRKRSVAKKRAQEVPILWSLKIVNLGWKNKENIILWRFLHPHNNIPHLPISPTCIQIFFQEILHSRESLSFLLWWKKRRCHCEGRSFWVRLDCCCCVFFLQEKDGDGDDDANGCCELHRIVSVQIGWCIRASTCRNWFQSPGMLACLLPSLRIFGIPLFLRVFLDARCEGELEKKSLSSKSALHGTCSKTLKSFCQDHLVMDSCRTSFGTIGRGVPRGNNVLVDSISVEETETRVGPEGQRRVG